MWMLQILLAFIGVSAGVAVAAGLFSLIVELGVIADFADRTHTADKLMVYETGTALGGISGNLISVFHIHLPAGLWGLGIYGLLAGIFVGCWAMALSEILNVYPVFLRRLNITKYLTAFILGIAIGKGIGAAIFFFQRW